MKTWQPVLMGFMGGMIACIFWTMVQKNGNRVHVPLPSRAADSQAERRNTLQVRNLELVDENGRVRAQLAMSREGSPGFFFFDPEGRVRLVLGIYPPSEGNLPFVVLNDSSQNAAGLFRLVGGKQVPYLIFKNQGADRAILGLSESSADRVFFTELGGSGKKNLIGGE